MEVSLLISSLQACHYRYVHPRQQQHPVPHTDTLTHGHTDTLTH